MVFSAPDTAESLGEASSPRSHSTCSSNSLGWRYRAAWPRYWGIYLEISYWPISRPLPSSTTTSLRWSRRSRDRVRTKASPAVCRTTTRSDTLTRLEKWAAMCRMWASSPCSTWSRSSSTPATFTIQGVAVFRLSRNTSLVMSM